MNDSTTQFSSGGVHIQPLARLDHLDAAVELQRAIWGYADLDVDSRAILVIASRFIGHLLGAFDGEALVGMALSFHTPSAERMHSHRVGVLPQYQNRGVGRALKLAQRQAAMDQGITILQWTFDPLQPRNAHFNLAGLGAVGRKYLPNFYGYSSSPLHGALPTDRLMVEWELGSPRVDRILRGNPYTPAADSVRIELPPAEQRAEPAQQAELRNAFRQHLSQGYAVTGFISSTGRDYYTLEKL